MHKDCRSSCETDKLVPRVFQEKVVVDEFVRKKCFGIAASGSKTPQSRSTDQGSGQGKGGPTETLRRPEPDPPEKMLIERMERGWESKEKIKAEPK